MQLSVYELYDLAEEVRRRIGGDPLGMLTYANRTDSLYDMLVAIGLDGLLPGGPEMPQSATRIVVLGASMVGVGKLRSIAEGLGVDRDDMEFCLDYDRLKHYDFSKFRDREAYKAVLFGPGPHSTPGKGGSSSAMEEMAGHPETYPPTIEIREASGGLKITANSFRAAILRMLELC